MSVDQVDIVDLISVDPETGQVVLTVSDHLNWSDSIDHQNILQRKLNAYLAFVESGEILERYPHAKDRPVAFKVVFKFKPDQEGEGFLTRAKEVFKSAGFQLQHEIFAESYDN
jgi:uncharacterized protein DUF6572